MPVEVVDEVVPMDMSVDELREEDRWFAERLRGDEVADHLPEPELSA